MISFLAVIFLSFLSEVKAADNDSCAYFRHCGSNGSSGGNSSKSHPSSGTAASFNPSNISRIKGLGVEFLYQANNPLGYSLVTGTGKFGGALISSSVENGFFGNRSIEIDELYLQRRIDKKRFKNRKLHVALGAKLLDKKNVSFDFGVSVKRNPDIKKLNLGFGFSGKVSFLNFGYYVYRDDMKVALEGYSNPYNYTRYSVLYNNSYYQEDYTVQTFTLGTKILNLAIDAGMIQTKYDFYPQETLIAIYSSSLNAGNFLFNFAYRRELSSNQKEDDGNLFIRREKRNFYGGIQYLVNKHLLFGVAHNHFLLNEWSATMTLFL